MKSRTADSAYRTARPTFTNRGPVPDNLDFANHAWLTFRSLATSAGWSSGSRVPGFVGAFIPASPPIGSRGWSEDAGHASANHALVTAKLSAGASQHDGWSTQGRPRSSTDSIWPARV